MSIKSLEAYGAGFVPSSCWSGSKRDAACVRAEPARKGCVAGALRTGLVLNLGAGVDSSGNHRTVAVVAREVKLPLRSAHTHVPARLLSNLKSKISRALLLQWPSQRGHTLFLGCPLGV